VQSILWFAFQIVSVTGGAALGVFLLGILTKRKSNWGNVIAMIASTVAMAIVLILSKFGLIHLAWSWLIVIGTSMTFAIGYVLGEKEKST
jgi:Na+/proline symporter